MAQHSLSIDQDRMWLRYWKEAPAFCWTLLMFAIAALQTCYLILYHSSVVLEGVRGPVSLTFLEENLIPLHFLTSWFQIK